MTILSEKFGKKSALSTQQILERTHSSTTYRYASLYAVGACTLDMLKCYLGSLTDNVSQLIATVLTSLQGLLVHTEP